MRCFEMFWDVLRCFVLLHLGLWAAGIGAGVSFAIHSGEVQALRCIACLATMVKVLDFSQSYSGHEFSVNFLFSPGNQSCYVVSACFKFVPSFLQLLIYAIIIPWLSTRYPHVSFCFFACWFEAIALAWVVSQNRKVSRSTGLRFLASLVTMVLARRNLACIIVQWIHMQISMAHWLVCN